ncbi:MAG: hypothetical protein IT280_01535 [Ignavibacteria bacterium]|nr:hypothetical protein [Ignavibacteria bacterium]
MHSHRSTQDEDEKGIEIHKAGLFIISALQGRSLPSPKGRTGILHLSGCKQ